MDTTYMLNDYTDIRVCSYRGEVYSVRDNGAVLRHAREGKRKRQCDDTWTFGRANIKTGYMEIGSERVHRIVAYAFLGEPPTPQHVVDHIDTNRRNNRPQNLRWLTKLENVLNNPITRRKIEYLCGSIEAFINDPSIIQEFVNENPNFEWMRTVTQEEAKASYERLCAWTKETKKTSTGTIGDWIYIPLRRPSDLEENCSFKGNLFINSQGPENLGGEIPVGENLAESLTLNCLQRYWHTPTEFPLCPVVLEANPLNDYLNNLKIGSIVSKNRNSIHYIDDFALCNNNLLAIATHADDGIKKFSLILVTYENGKFIHEGKMFFEARGAEKALVLAQGLEWDGEDGLDDYC